MKTIAKINPEEEYKLAKQIIAMASNHQLDEDNSSKLNLSVDNLIQTARILIEREERRRGIRPPLNNRKIKEKIKAEKKRDFNKKPSLKHPDLEIKNEKISMPVVPNCPCCQAQMQESGLYSTSEKLDVTAPQYYITISHRVKYNCSKCHGSMVNTPPRPSIMNTSNFGDSFVIDAALAKYCDLIPMERYLQIAERNGLEGLAAHSLIGLTHHLANFLNSLYQKIKSEVKSTSILLADETPHKMLEGDDTKNWYLWGFFSKTACILEAHDTRSGDVLFEFLKDSQAKYLLCDGYSAYGRAIKMLKSNLDRTVVEVNCNAHAYRYFEQGSVNFVEESKVFLEQYGEIYNLEKKLKQCGSDEEKFSLRQKMIPYFEKIKKVCEKNKETYPRDSRIDVAIKYFLNQYDQLIICTNNIEIPLDNNLSERELRSPVIGRKTWFGSHSKRGALTSAVLFSIVQTCKMNNVNPRKYFPWIVERIHKNEEILTPHEYFVQMLATQ